MSSFSVLFNSYKNLLFKKDFEEKQSTSTSTNTKETPPADTNTSSITSSDIQTATKKIFTIAVNQNAATLTKLQFYPSLSQYFVTPKTEQKTQSQSQSTNPPQYSCTPLLREIGWDLLTELFLLYNKEPRVSHFLCAICTDISPRELSIMFSEVFTHPMLSIAATHHHYQLHTMQNHYILNDEDSEQQKQMILNLNTSNKQRNMDASDDILSFHKQINYIKTQTLFIQCITILFAKLTEKPSSKHSINHFYASLIPTAILHFQTLSKELSYQFYLHNTTQYHHSHHSHGVHKSTESVQQTRARSMSSDSIKALDATKKQRQQWLVERKREYERYLKSIYALFAAMVNNHCNLRSTEIKDEFVDINTLIQCFQSGKEESDDKEAKLVRSNNVNTLWLARYGFGVLSGVYWWYNVFYNEEYENDGDVNNDSAEVLANIKRGAYNIFVNDHIDLLKSEISVKLCHNVGMNGNVLFGIREYLSGLESKLESEKPWHLNSEGLMAANPSTPTPQLQPMSSIGHPDLNTIVEEMDDIADEMDADTLQSNGTKSAVTNDANDTAVSMNGKTPELVVCEDEADEDGFVDMDNADADDDGWDDNDGGIGFGDVDPSQLRKVQETQHLVDELKTWNEYIDLFGVSCYYHSLWVLLQSDDCADNNGEKFQTHSKHIWKCISLLFEQLTTLPAGIEFGEFILSKAHPTNNVRVVSGDSNTKRELNMSSLLSSQQFHAQGLWQLVQYLTSQLKGISDRALHQKLWQFIVHLINASDLKTRFQCIVSTALQCPIPVVQSLMFTELKNQIFNNWNIDLVGGDCKEDGSDETLNPFCSRQVVMVLVQRLGKELQNMSLQAINSELDSLNACLNLCRFIIMKDKETNYTQIYDEDCPLKPVVQQLYDEMSKIAGSKEEESGNGNGNGNSLNELQAFQKQMMKNQFLVSLDLVKRIQEMYHK